ncbi:uncharacterized protein MONBRDRAFT_7913 [Monosiga brevicollis MX1]|uniref:ENTH domain-containing protein n=1 Tax=Monosiga brevicollis TaxID=81824 RepID=A9UYG3_MONBE|nr:uncharacterized protein MONBRDRAFT_7913 [Monosiga brevicollis MX1]EDQ89457.1 predicted protein [Monosiga brevicollis MX1]|eukprot:XP_001745486.1 hypothetical protein [Monosiga brevicollis MX1]
MPPRRSLREQLRAAVSSPIDRVVFKATDNTAARPKQKHVEHLIHLSYHEHFDAQEYVAILRRRYEAPTSTGLTMAKALALTHSLMNNSSQYIAKMLLRDLREILVPLVDMYAVVAERFFQQPKMRAQKLLVLYKRFSSVCTRADGFLEACTRAQLLAGSGNMAQLAAVGN